MILGIEYAVIARETKSAFILGKGFFNLDLYLGHRGIDFTEDFTEDMLIPSILADTLSFDLPSLEDKQLFAKEIAQKVLSLGSSKVKLVILGCFLDKTYYSYIIKGSRYETDSDMIGKTLGEYLGLSPWLYL
jgi:hypothetical protein